MLIPKINFRKLQNIYKKKSDKSGQGSLIAVILASVIGTIIISSSTQWFLSMNKTMDRTDDRLEAMSIAMSEWQRLEHMSLDELEANRENYKTPYNVGDKFTVGVNLGGQGFFNNGTCNALTGDYASESPNCFKDTVMTVYDKDGKAIYTTRSLPLSSQGGGGSSGGPAPAVDWEHGQTLSSGSAVSEDGVVKSGTFTAHFESMYHYAHPDGNLTSYTSLVINGVQVKSGGHVEYNANAGVRPNDYIETPDPSPAAYFYVKKGDVVISYGSADGNLKGNPEGTIYGNYRFYPLRKK